MEVGRREFIDEGEQFSCVKKKGMMKYFGFKDKEQSGDNAGSEKKRETLEISRFILEFTCFKNEF